MTVEAEQTRDDWLEAMAEVTACHYDVRAGRALAFGLISSRHFRIAYNYRVGEEMHTGECFCETARSPGSLFSIRYDPDQPRMHHSSSEIRQGLPLLALGIAGSILLSLSLLLVMRGCSPS